MLVTNDAINPNHYKSASGLETIDVIRAFTDGLNGAEAFCIGNVIKYVTRYSNKNGVEDLKKAREYLNYVIKEYEKNDNRQIN